MGKFLSWVGSFLVLLISCSVGKGKGVRKAFPWLFKQFRARLPDLNKHPYLKEFIKGGFRFAGTFTAGAIAGRYWDDVLFWIGLGRGMNRMKREIVERVAELQLAQRGAKITEAEMTVIAEAMDEDLKHMAMELKDVVCTTDPALAHALILYDQRLRDLYLDDPRQKEEMLKASAEALETGHMDKDRISTGPALVSIRSGIIYGMASIEGNPTLIKEVGDLLKEQLNKVNAITDPEEQELEKVKYIDLKTRYDRYLLVYDILKDMVDEVDRMNTSGGVLATEKIKGRKEKIDELQGLMDGYKKMLEDADPKDKAEIEQKISYLLAEWHAHTKVYEKQKKAFHDIVNEFKNLEEGK